MQYINPNIILKDWAPGHHSFFRPGAKPVIKHGKYRHSGQHLLHKWDSRETILPYVRSRHYLLSLRISRPLKLFIANRILAFAIPFTPLPIKFALAQIEHMCYNMAPGDFPHYPSLTKNVIAHSAPKKIFNFF